jgi:hypothetical protein
MLIPRIAGPLLFEAWLTPSDRRERVVVWVRERAGGEREVAMANRIARPGLALLLAAAAVAATAPAAMAKAPGGKPTVEREVVNETFFDDFILDICGVATNTTLTQRTTIKTFPDGSQTVHVNAEFIPDDPRIASERNAFTDRIAPDGTVTTGGLAIRLYRKGEGTIIRDAGWVRFLEDGLVVRGPHPFLETDPADVYC